MLLVFHSGLISALWVASHPYHSWDAEVCTHFSQLHLWGVVATFAWQPSMVQRAQPCRSGTVLAAMTCMEGCLPPAGGLSVLVRTSSLPPTSCSVTSCVLWPLVAPWLLSWLPFWFWLVCPSLRVGTICLLLFTSDTGCPQTGALGPVPALWLCCSGSWPPKPYRHGSRSANVTTAVTCSRASRQLLCVYLHVPPHKLLI